MAGTSKIVVSRNSEAAIQEFLSNNLAPELSREKVALLLNSMELLRDIRGLTPEDKTKFVEKIDQVCRDNPLPPLKPPPIISAKAYPTINLKNAKFVAALGGVCSATEQLPTSAILSAGLKKRGNIAEDSGGTADIWQGEYRGTHVAIKVFRISRNLKDAKRVCVRRLRNVYRLTKFTDPVETCAHVEEVVP